MMAVRGMTQPIAVQNVLVYSPRLRGDHMKAFGGFVMEWQQRSPFRLKSTQKQVSRCVFRNVGLRPLYQLI
jgi:hypothetical protein